MKTLRRWLCKSCSKSLQAWFQVHSDAFAKLGASVVNTGSGQRLWHHLEDLEYERRVDIIEKHYPRFIPVIALAQDGPEAGLRALGQYWNTQDSQQIRQAYRGFVRTVVHSSVDLLYTGDGQNHGDRFESFDRFEQACRSALEDKEPATLADLGQHVAQQCIMQLPDSSPDEQVQKLREALLGDSTLERTALSPALQFSEQSRIFDAGPQNSGDDKWQATSFRALAENWAADPKFLKEMSVLPSEGVRSMVLRNPMADPSILRRALELRPYPSQFWAKVDDEEGGIFDLPEWAQEEIDEKGHLEWDYILSNPMLSTPVVTGVANQIAGHFMERDVYAGVLLHPSCPRSRLRDTFERSTHSDYLLCLAANPNTPSDVLAQMALLDKSDNLDVVENLFVTMNEVLIGIAVNPTTSIESRAVLAMLGNEQVDLALRATSSNVGSLIGLSDAAGSVNTPNKARSKTSFPERVEILSDFWELSQMDVADYPDTMYEHHISEALEECADTLVRWKDIFIVAQHIASGERKIWDVPQEILLEINKLFGYVCEELWIEEDGYSSPYKNVIQLIETSAYEKP